MTFSPGEIAKTVTIHLAPEAEQASGSQLMSLIPREQGETCPLRAIVVVETVSLDVAGETELWLVYDHSSLISAQPIPRGV